MTTIRHFSIAEFCRGAHNQAVAPSITRPLHATDHLATFVLNDGTTAWSFPLPARGWTGRKCRFGSLRCDPTGIRNQFTSQFHRHVFNPLPLVRFGESDYMVLIAWLRALRVKVTSLTSQTLRTTGGSAASCACYDVSWKSKRRKARSLDIHTIAVWFWKWSCDDQNWLG